jgi:hypothetical protein
MGIKYAYINKLYNEVSGEKKKLLDNLVKKYVPDFEKYRGLKYEACVYKLLKENKVLEK